MQNPSLDSEHYKRITEADLSYPIDLGVNPRIDKLMPFDGLHRMCKAKIMGLEKIKCRIIPIEKAHGVKLNTTEIATPSR